MSALRDLANNVKVTKCLVAATRTADANGAAIDMQGYGSLMFIANFGASGDTLSGSLKSELELEHSDDNSSWSDCADTDLTAAVDGTNDGCWGVIDATGEDSSVYKVGYIGNKRYVRPVYNITGTHTNGMPVSIEAVQGHPLAAPVT